MERPKWFGAEFPHPGVYYARYLNEQQYLRDTRLLGYKYPSRFVREGAAATTHSFDNKKTYSFVCIDPYRDNTICEMYAMLVHEAVHIYQEMMRSMSEDKPGEEIQAYYIQRISLDLMGELEDFYENNPHAHPDNREHN